MNWNSQKIRPATRNVDRKSAVRTGDVMIPDWKHGVCHPPRFAVNSVKECNHLQRKSFVKTLQVRGELRAFRMFRTSPWRQHCRSAGSTCAAGSAASTCSPCTRHHLARLPWRRSAWDANSPTPTDPEVHVIDRCDDVTTLNESKHWIIHSSWKAQVTNLEVLKCVEDSVAVDRQPALLPRLRFSQTHLQVTSQLARVARLDLQQVEVCSNTPKCENSLKWCVFTFAASSAAVRRSRWLMTM